MLDLQGFKSDRRLEEKRDIERKGTRFLLQNMLNSETVELEYDPHNRPYLKGRSEHISISHSHRWLAISIHKTNETGVDVELIREKVSHIKHKFLCDEEMAFAHDDIEKMILLWTCKEAIYKVYGKRELDFKKIVIQNCSIKDSGEIIGTIHFDEHLRQYKLMYRKFDTYFLALIVHEIQ